MSERITEDIVREHFKRDPLFDSIKLEEQKSENPKINKLLKNASKKGGGRGMPEFIITTEDEKGLLIVVECKADVLRHESKTRDKYAEYAVDGALLYSSYLAKEYDVLSVAVSGQKKDYIKVSYFIQRLGKKNSERIFGNKLVTLEDIIAGIKQDKEKRKEKYEELISYSKKLNSALHKLKIKEDKRSLLVSGILIALENKDFYRSYSGITGDLMLADALVNTIRQQLKNGNLQDNKIENLISHYSFIRSYPSLVKDETLKNLINDIDNNINGYARTYKYYDVLGQFYIEFLRYSNADKGLGIVLTPPHITEFFADLVDIKTNDIVMDNCAGTSGFLVAAMKKMIDKCNGDLQKEKAIKQNQLYGVEYQPEIYPLAVSNMFLHADGKSNIINGNCFDSDVIKLVRSKKATIGFLNPPYKSEKEDTEEFEFVLNSLSCLYKHGQCVAILPMSCALAQKGERLRLKEELLSKHTLRAVFSMPHELFHNSKVSVGTCIMVLKAHLPHPNNVETFFGYFKDDGFYVKKHRGRSDYDNKWQSKKEKWLSLYLNNKEEVGFSVTKKVTAEDEWCAEAYMETDYSKLSKKEFERYLKKYIAFKVLHEE